MTENHPIYTLDLDFQGIPGVIAAYLIPHRRGGILIESGPGSTIAVLQRKLQEYQLSAADISDVFLTHIHLDHAGAAGWLARQGARVHVHEVGAPHLLNPEKLLASATRIYGEMMDALWGEFLPVPEDRLSILHDQQEVDVEGLCLRAIATPGHAEHHLAYLFEDVCFSGDIGGVRLAGLKHLRLPMPPPELNLEKWRLSLERLSHEDFRRIAPTHFGIYQDRNWHLKAVKAELDRMHAWIEANMPAGPSVEALRKQFVAFEQQRARQEGLDESIRTAYETANPAFMSADGIHRYWRKVRQA